MDTEKIYKPDFIFLGEDIRIRRISVNGQYYYSNVDIQKACEMGKSRSQLRASMFQEYSIVVLIDKRTKRSRFLSEDGVKELLSRSRYPKASEILNKFLSPHKNKVVLNSNLYSRMDIKKTKDTFHALKNYVYNVMKHSDDAVTLQVLVDNIEKELVNGGIL